MAYENTLGVSVVQAAERRVLEAFNDNKFIAMSFSGGKDSICMADVVVKTMMKYDIDFSRLIVIFFDEEAIYPDLEQITLQWRSKFLSLGAKFYWMCLPIRHFNSVNKLANDESFYCWEHGKEDVWVRPMPKFAIRHHKDFKFGDSYQEFAKKMFKSIPQMVGLRMAESIQRRSAISGIRNKDKKRFIYPIYDWKDDDVWLYIQRNNLEIPVAYMYLYKVGVPRNRLRISQFFSVDTIRVLPKVLEFYPDLYERIIRREPNAELVMLYWDTEMFRSSRQNSTHNKNKDYRKLFNEEMEKAAKHPDMYPGYKQCKRLLIKAHENMSNNIYKRMYGLLIAGDPKDREYRALLGKIRKDLMKQHNEQNKN